MKRSQPEKTRQEEKKQVRLEDNVMSPSLENVRVRVEEKSAASSKDNYERRQHTHDLTISPHWQAIFNFMLMPAILAWLEANKEKDLDTKADKLCYGNRRTQAAMQEEPKNSKVKKAVLDLQQEETYRYAYQLDKQKRTAQIALQDTKARKEVEVLLNYVVQGEQDNTEALLKKSPVLALAKGTVTDLSKRTFKDITAFQYAVWALDWHMWNMLLKYLPPEAAAQQLQELESNGTVHGVHFSLDFLISTLDAHVKNYPSWNIAQLRAHWQQQVGRAQLQLPVHVVNEYCHPTRPFLPCPDFSADIVLARSMETDEGHWFATIYKGDALGSKFGILRSDLPEAWGWSGENGRGAVASCIVEDRDALQSLWITRQQQVLSLKQALTRASTLQIGKGK